MFMLRETIFILPCKRTFFIIIIIIITLRVLIITFRVHQGSGVSERKSPATVFYAKNRTRYTVVLVDSGGLYISRFRTVGRRGNDADESN